MNRETKVQIAALFLYAAIIMRMDKSDGIRTAAKLCLWYSGRCRTLGNWAWTQAIRADNAYRELITP